MTVAGPGRARRSSLWGGLERWVRPTVWGASAKREPGPVMPEVPVGGRDRSVAASLALSTLGMVLPVAVAVALVPLRDTVTASTATLILVLPVLFATIVAGRLTGVVAAAAAALSFDVLLTEPYHSFTIDAASDVESAIVLGVIALVIIAVVSAGLDARGRATSRRAELVILVAVAEAAASGDRERMTACVTESLEEYLGLLTCDWSPGFGGTVGSVLRRSGRIERRDEARLPDGYLEVPVVWGPTELGRLVMRSGSSRPFSLEERRTVVAVADTFAAGLGAAATR